VVSLRVERTGEVFLASVEVRSGFWGRLRGYLLRARPGAGEGILLVGAARVHTWWVAFPLDLYFLDGSLRLIAARPGTPPFRVPPSPAGCRHVLEVPSAGDGPSPGVRPGDRLVLCLRVGR